MAAATEVKVDVTVAQNLGLTAEEYQRIVDLMGRVPNFNELSIFSVMWSEHCSYKNSITWLKTLPRDGEKLLVGAGEENAGLVDIGDGLACAFKIESHNHPSAIEPYQGAATGVGGIHRDIFTMGARPIASLNSLRFGDPSLRHTKHLVAGVVKGIGDYGNCFGVPVVGGEVFFHPSYNQNILVNAMSVGIVRHGETISAVADGPGNPVFIVGSATGKDGIHGATFSSADLTEDSAEDLPAVQVGDPFQEKLLLEASLEVIKTGAVVGMQDMGAAGITCSTSEMSAKSGTGMRIDLDKVPTRQANMAPWEILLSESQERMLIVGKKGREADLLAVFEKWDLECAQIGEVTDTGRLEFYAGGKLVADVPSEPLVLGGGAPVYEREYSRPAYLDKVEAFRTENVPVPHDLKAAARTTFLSPNLVSKAWVTDQYDGTVRTNSMSENRPSDAALVRIKGTKKALVVTTDCNATYVYADPYRGTMIAVAEAARNIVCSGGEPVAITNCLNFGNPYNKEAYYQFVHAIKGMGDACRAFNTPVTGGNVSFYNQSQFEGGRVEPVYPTPTIGMLGILDNVKFRMTLDFKDQNDVIYLLGDSHDDIASSEYLRRVHGIEHSPVPFFDLKKEQELHAAVAGLIRKELIKSAHDVSDGGLFQSLTESAMAGGHGFRIDTSAAFRKDAFLFGEAQGRVVVTADEARTSQLEDFLRESGVGFTVLGRVEGDDLTVDGENWGELAEWMVMHELTLGAVLEE
ncbi:phosphoribosylformylglycinamidine synthase subunit PurL [Neolewinella lacunae]|uniref:Phosphoribosylformylglycinamidine synthase subunit PurL n=1 Tax=Neolewinella lacunae TaxID=1517758 RepID=A0A923PLK1_9BACT|nr:phosphoribosylformylglycinamidine synthase subunit PurL [Neolewinella lacunae]MBC6993529.1 phosphoribosylformylglycinamidine synthase subunit PurL [Neolewinella lacunae]MDN3636195.1 phosphoribosylformylglycinamidine synthase subunit PurL [Neolewinella lacunae]